MAASAPVGPLNPAMKVSPMPAPVTKAEAEKTFWGLGAHFWKQIYDGKFHEFGPDVFDKGLHGKTVEPGFFKSMKEGCEFTSQHLTERLSIPFYKDLHRILCAHFKGRENATQIEASATGIFFGSEWSTANIQDMSGEGKKDYYKEYKKVEAVFENTFGGVDSEQEMIMKINKELEDEASGLKEKNIKPEEDNDYLFRKMLFDISLKAFPHKKLVDAHREEWRKKIKEIREYLIETCKKLSIPLIVDISIPEEESPNYQKDKITLKYLITNPKLLEEIVQKLFDHYNEQMDEINLKLKTANPAERDALMNQKIIVIAELFQMLEWLHPFTDGQGRCDLVLQAKLLSEEGLNPAILDEPYFSSYSNLQDTANYLANGIKRWQAEREFFTSK